MENRPSKRNIVLPLAVAAALLAGLWLGHLMPRGGRSRGASGYSLQAALADDKLNTVMRLVHGNYVDVPVLDSIEEELIPMLLGSLDPHSVYIPAREMDGVTESIEGRFDGVGITFNMFTDTVRVISVITGGPSARAGVVPGDRILTIDDSLVAGRKIAQDSIVGRLRGPRGSEVTLGIARQGLDGLLPITVTRGVIPVKSVDAGFMIDEHTGYIRLTTFSRNSHDEMMRILAAMRDEASPERPRNPDDMARTPAARRAGMTRLIFDLRGNSGGLLDQAIRITNEFLPEGSLIVYTEGRASRRMEQYANGRGRLQDLDLVVLIDEGSASASEILAGALQDNDRGTIVGRRSFGKGLVQEQIPLADGSAIRLTIARYYTPVGRSIQKPYDEGTEAYYEDLSNRYAHSELFSADSIRFADSLRFTTPGGRTVYGGGGIMPDVFVPLDTMPLLTDYVREVAAKNILLRYTIAFSDTHREALNAIGTLDGLDAFFEGRGDLLPDFVRYAAANGTADPGAATLDASRRVLEAELKASIGRNTPLEDNAYYYYLLPFMPEVVKALEL
jgi:carboxyl-terminal processing protease